VDERSWVVKRWGKEDWAQKMPFAALLYLISGTACRLVGKTHASSETMHWEVEAMKQVASCSDAHPTSRWFLQNLSAVGDLLFVRGLN